MFNNKNISGVRSSIVLIAHPTIQTAAFARHLAELLSVSVSVHNINKPFTLRLAKTAVVLFDISLSTKKLNGLWQDILASYSPLARLLIINSEQKYEVGEMAKWPALYGIFRHDDEESVLLKSISAVLHGEQTAALSLEPEGRYPQPPTENTPLTERECEILNELRQGATNMDIARSLFISENTVRTHLYNVFRKLSVKNRIQAVSWANAHLRH